MRRRQGLWLVALVAGALFVIWRVLAIAFGVAAIVVFRIVPALPADEPRVGPAVALAAPGEGSPRPAPIERSGIYLVPMDGTPSERVARLATQLTDRLEIRVRTLPRLRSEVVDYDPDRKQLDADSLWSRIRDSHPPSVERFAVIAITDGDLHWAQTDWRFTFGIKGDEGYGVVSTARMDPVHLGQPRNDELLETRLRKMVLRQVGQVFFDLPLGENPDSVLGPTLAGVEELDRMTEEFCPARPGERLSC